MYLDVSWHLKRPPCTPNPPKHNADRTLHQSCISLLRAIGSHAAPGSLHPPYAGLPASTRAPSPQDMQPAAIGLSGPDAHRRQDEGEPDEDCTMLPPSWLCGYAAPKGSLTSPRCCVRALSSLRLGATSILLLTALVADAYEACASLLPAVAVASRGKHDLSLGQNIQLPHARHDMPVSCADKADPDKAHTLD